MMKERRKQAMRIDEISEHVDLQLNEAMENFSKVLCEIDTHIEKRDKSRLRQMMKDPCFPILIESNIMPLILAGLAEGISHEIFEDMARTISHGRNGTDNE